MRNLIKGMAGDPAVWQLVSKNGSALSCGTSGVSIFTAPKLFLPVLPVPLSYPVQAALMAAPFPRLTGYFF